MHDNIVRNINAGSSERFGTPKRGERSAQHPEWNRALLWALLGVIGAIALVSFVLSNIYIIVGIVALLALFAAYYRGDDPFALEPHDFASPAGEAAH